MFKVVVLVDVDLVLGLVLVFGFVECFCLFDGVVVIVGEVMVSVEMVDVLLLFYLLFECLEVGVFELECD